MTAPLDGLAVALGQVLARARQEWRRDYDLAIAQHDALVARLRAEVAEHKQRVDALVAERLAGVHDGKDGEPGRDGIDGIAGVDGAAGRDGKPGADGKDGVDGRDGEPGVDGAAGKDGDPGVDGKDGVDGRDGEPGVDGKDGVDGAAGKDGESGINGKDGADGADGRDGALGVNGKDGVDGAPGKFVPPKAWTKGIHYEAALVAHDGSTYCALRDTADEPPHDDWVLVAARGECGPEPYVGEIFRKFDPTRKYRKFDLVHQNGSEWRANKDNPGQLPVDGTVDPDDWVLAAKVGKGGQPGPKGDRGERGVPGFQPQIVEWRKDGYRAIPIMSDGTPGPALDVREFFELYHGEAG